MENPRPEKVAVVAEVRAKLDATPMPLCSPSTGARRGRHGRLRRALRDAGGEYKIYKNTLVRFAARDLGLEIDDLLTGPTAIAFVRRRPGDPVNVAKALQDFAKTNPSPRGQGRSARRPGCSSVDDVKALADLAPREVLLARLAGGSPPRCSSSPACSQALPRNFAYGLKALIDQGRRSRRPCRGRSRLPSHGGGGPRAEARAAPRSNARASDVAAVRPAADETTPVRPRPEPHRTELPEPPRAPKPAPTADDGIRRPRQADGRHRGAAAEADANEHRASRPTTEEES